MVVRVIYGLRLTLLMGAVSVLAGGGIGTLLGLMAAFYRRCDGLVMRCMDVLLSFPAILFGLAIAAIFGRVCLLSSWLCQWRPFAGGAHRARGGGGGDGARLHRGSAGDRVA